MIISSNSQNTSFIVLQMASLVQPAVSDQEMMSQTETEDTDNGDASYASVTSQSTKTSSTSDSNLDSMSSNDLEKCLNNKQCFTEPVAHSVDLTDVTELEDNASAVEDNNPSKRSKHENVEKDKDKVGFPNLDFTTDWYNHDCFKTYWEHYRQVMSWCGKHFEVYGDLLKQSAGRGRGSVAGQGYSSRGPFDRFQYPNSVYTLPWNHPYVNNHQNMHSNVNITRNGCRSTTVNNRRKKKPKRHKAKSSNSSTCSEETQTETSEEFQMEITQDMIDFFAKTQEHRRQRGR